MYFVLLLCILIMAMLTLAVIAMFEEGTPIGNAFGGMFIVILYATLAGIAFSIGEREGKHSACDTVAQEVRTGISAEEPDNH